MSPAQDRQRIERVVEDERLLGATRAVLPCSGLRKPPSSEKPDFLAVLVWGRWSARGADRPSAPLRASERPQRRADWHTHGSAYWTCQSRDTSRWASRRGR